MKKKAIKEEKKCTNQLNLFQESERSARQVAISEETTKGESPSKIISLANYQHQLDIKKFYEVANKLTSHLK